MEFLRICVHIAIEKRDSSKKELRFIYALHIWEVGIHVNIRQKRKVHHCWVCTCLGTIFMFLRFRSRSCSSLVQNFLPRLFHHIICRLVGACRSHKMSNTVMDSTSCLCSTAVPKSRRWAIFVLCSWCCSEDNIELLNCVKRVSYCLTTLRWTAPGCDVNAEWVSVLEVSLPS